MIRKSIALLSLLLLAYSFASAQRLSVFGTGTMFEALENPAVGVLNRNCNLFQFNCFIPSVAADGRYFGDADTLVRNYGLNGSKAIYNWPPLDNPQKLNYGVAVGSINWLTAKVMLDYRTGSELLIEMSTKGYGSGDLKNEAISAFNKGNLGVGSYPNQFLTNSYGSSYTQVAFGYRRDINDFLSAGIKLGYVSGINYGDLQFTNTRMDIQQSLSTPDENQLYLSLTGTSKLLGKTESFEAKDFLPNFKNPGLTISAGVNGRINDDWEASLYLKDAGFINWKDNNKAKIYDGRRYINGVLLKDYSSDSLKTLLKFNDTTATTEHFRTSLPARLEGGVSGYITHYLRSAVFVSMPLKDLQTDIALINDFYYKDYHFILQAQYNTHNTFQVGTHIMIKSPIVDFIVGSDNLLGTIKLAKAANEDTEYYYDSRTTANVNFGLVFKFGKCYYSETAVSVPMDDKRVSRRDRKRVARTRAMGE